MFRPPIEALKKRGEANSFVLLQLPRCGPSLRGVRRPQGLIQIN